MIIGICGVCASGKSQLSREIAQRYGFKYIEVDKYNIKLLKQFSKYLEKLYGFDASKDLGAGSLETFRHIILPSLIPGITSGAMLAFTLSLDDVVISYFTAGPSSNTLPLKIYSMIKTGITPDVNALSTIILVVTFTIILLFTLKQMRSLKKEVVR